VTDIHSRILPSRKPAARAKHVPAEDGISESAAPLAASLRLQIVCIIATLIAASIFTLTEHDGHAHTWWCAFEITMQTLLVIVGTAFFRARQRLLHDSSVVLPALVMVVTMSLICEPIQRLFFGHGHPFEVLVMHSQSNLMLALAVCGFRLSFQRLAMLIAVFLTIFSCTISNAHGLLPLTTLFAMSSLAWLVTSWWETVDRRLVQPQRKRRPLLWLATGAVIPLLLAVSAASFGTNTVTAALKGFLPSSGGNGEFDPFSRGGVNDGDALVAGNNNIKSFAALDDAPFLDSDKPSLYDMFNDTFDEPPRKIKEQQRAIALTAEELKHIHAQMAEAKQAGREFTLVREDSSTDRRRIKDLDTHAAFYVAGPVPAHFRMQVYEHFDGLTWYPVESLSVDETRHCPVEKVEDRDWLRIPQRGSVFDVFSDTATHSLKVTNLQGNIIPSPPQMVGVSIDHVDRVDMYSVADSGVVSLQRKSVPELTPINVASKYVCRERLAEFSLPGMISSGSDLTKALPTDHSMQKIQQLAESWTTDVPNGWQAVEAIESRLRQHCVLDRNSRLPPDCTCPVSAFLFETRRGPEYLFASSATCLLRSLGYSTRLVSGFYARPDNYDVRKQHTAVFARDAHFWCEVCIGMDTWITIEASPGYGLLTPPLSFGAQLMQRCLDAWHAAVANTFLLLALLITGTGVLLYRRHISAMLLTWYWRWIPSQSLRTRTLTLAAIVDIRLYLAGHPRGAGITLQRCAMQTELQHVRPELLRLSTLANAARFGPQLLPLDDRVDIRSHRELLALERRLNITTLRSSNTTVDSIHESAFAK